MAAVPVRVPDEKHRSLNAFAKSRGAPLNHLFDAMTPLMLAVLDF